jgi:hypothetical protein
VVVVSETPKTKPKPEKAKPTHSDAGKGDKSRISDTKKYSDNWEKIFGKKSDKKPKESSKSIKT